MNSCFVFIQRNGYTFRGDNFVKIVLPPSEKGSTLKGKNLLPQGNKFFPFRVDPFSEEHLCTRKQMEVTKVISLVNNA